MTICHLNNWLSLPKVLLVLPFTMSESRQTKLNLLFCISTSSNYQPQESGLQLPVGNAYLKHIWDVDYYFILPKVLSQLPSFPMAHNFYLKAKKSAAADEHSYRMLIIIQ